MSGPDEERKKWKLKAGGGLILARICLYNHTATLSRRSDGQTSLALALIVSCQSGFLSNWF